MAQSGMEAGTSWSESNDDTTDQAADKHYDIHDYNTFYKFSMGIHNRR